MNKRSKKVCSLKVCSLNESGNESGHAMIEMAISLVFLLNLTAGIIDFGSILNNYSSVVQAAHQGALLAATNNHLQTNTDQQFGNCKSIKSRNSKNKKISEKEQKQHLKVDEHIQQILNIKDSSLDNQSLCVTSRLEDSSSSDPLSSLEPSTSDKNVVVTIEVAYKTLLYGYIPIKAQARAPFLQ